MNLTEERRRHDGRKGPSQSRRRGSQDKAQVHSATRRKPAVSSAWPQCSTIFPLRALSVLGQQAGQSEGTMDRTKSHTHIPLTYVKVDYGAKLLKERISRQTFVRLGALLGVGTAGASVLAACAGSSGSGGSNDGSSGGSGENAPNGGPSVSSDKKIVSRAKEQASDSRAIARVSEVRPGTAMKFEDSGGNPAMLVHLRSGKFVAYSAVCPHEGCTVAYKNGQLACPCHGSIFDPKNARVVIGPAQRPLLKIPVEVRGGAVVRA